MKALCARFTWYKGSLSQHLDRALCNMFWDNFALNCSIRNLYRLKSDHMPILISTHSKQNRGDRSFRCLASWFCHVDFKDLISNNWKNDTPIVDSLVKFKEVLSTWNKKVYVNFF